MPTEPPNTLQKPPLPQPLTLAERDEAQAQYHDKVLAEIERQRAESRERVRSALRRWLDNA